jgi:hypothetical protein
VLKHLICMTWMWEQFERLYSLNHSVVAEIEALVPHVKCMVCTHSSPRLSANSPKSGEISVVVTE